MTTERRNSIETLNDDRQTDDKKSLIDKHILTARPSKEGDLSSDILKLSLDNEKKEINDFLYNNQISKSIYKNNVKDLCSPESTNIDFEKYSENYVKGNDKKFKKSIKKRLKIDIRKSIDVYNSWGALKCKNIGKKLLEYENNKLPLNYYLNRAINSLTFRDYHGPEEIFATKGLIDMLKTTCREKISVFYDYFLHSCSTKYFSFGTVSQTHKERHRSRLVSLFNYGFKDPVELWYCLRTEFGRYNGENRDCHPDLKRHIENLGLKDVYLTKDGKFLEEYGASSLIKALEIHASLLEPSETRLEDTNQEYSDDGVVSSDDESVEGSSDESVEESSGELSSEEIDEDERKE